MEIQLKDILKQVASMFCKYGIKSVSMDDVAREIGVSKKTVYLFFKDKEDLVLKSLEHIQASHLDWIQNLPRDQYNAVEEVLEINRKIREIFGGSTPVIDFDLRKYYPKLHKKVNANHDEVVLSMMETNIEKGRKEGLFRSDFDARLISVLHYRKAFDVISSFEPDEVNSRMDAMKQIIEYHLRGMCTPKGIEELEKYNQKHTTNEK
jgi:AcrR family transcriptional regulator